MLPDEGVASAAPRFFRAVHPGSGYAKAVTARLQAIEAGLGQDPPFRKPFLLLVKDICTMITQCKQSPGLPVSCAGVGLILILTCFPSTVPESESDQRHLQTLQHGSFCPELFHLFQVGHPVCFTNHIWTCSQLLGGMDGFCSTVPRFGRF